MSPENKAYIGGGVYVAFESGSIRLTTEDGYQAINTIYLEAEVWRALKAWVEKVEKGQHEP